MVSDGDFIMIIEKRKDSIVRYMNRLYVGTLVFVFVEQVA